MNKDNEALSKLRAYTSEGKTHYEATELLRTEGYTDLEINNATYALKSGKQDTNFDPKLAESLVQVASTITNDKEANSRRGKNAGIAVYPGGGMPLARLGGRLKSWWYLVPFLILIFLALYYFSTQ